MTDALQILLTGPLPAAGAALLALLLLSAIKAARRGVSLTFSGITLLRSFVLKLTLWNGVLIALLSFVLYGFRYEVSDAIQYAEQLYRPVYVVQYDSTELVRAYQKRLSVHCSPMEYKTVTDSVAAWNKEFSLEPSAIYECALPECGMDPFVVRTDGKAAGFIQFTTTGLSGSGVTLDQVKSLCQTRNTTEIMRLTGWYLRSRANGRRFTTGADVYALVFAPVCLEKPETFVLYAGANNPAYYLNRGLDGWEIDGNKVVRNPSKIDYQITKKELNLWLEYHKQKLLQK